MADFAQILIRATDQTKGAFDSAERNIRRLSDVAGRLGGLLAGLGVGVSFAAMLAAVKSAADHADEMGKLAQKVGVATESLSALDYAAKLSDVSTEQLSAGLRILSRNATDVAGGTGEARKAFDALGISVTGAGGQLKGADSLIGEIADRFAGMADGTAKTALAMELFGRSGADMIPLLNQGSAGLREAGDEARRLGLIISQETAEKAERFNDNLTRLAGKAQGLKMELAETLLPALSDITDAMAEAARNSGILEAVWVGLGGAAAHALGLDYASQARKRIAEIEADLPRLRKAMETATFTGGETGKAWLDAIIPDIRLNPKAREDLRRRIGELESEAKALRAGLAAPKKSTPAGLDDPRLACILRGGIWDGKQCKEKSKSGASEKLDDLSQTPFALIAKQRAEVEKARQEEIRRFVEGQQEDINALNRAIHEDGVRAAQEYQSALDRLLSGTTLAKTEALQNDIDLLNRGFFDGTIGAEQYDEAIRLLTTGTEKLAEQAKETDDIARELGLTFSSAFEDAVVAGKSLGQVLQGLYQDLLRLSVRKAVTEPLAAGFTGLLKNIDFSRFIPSFDVGTPFVQRDTLAMVHRGERIVPAAQNRAGAGSGNGDTFIFNFHGVTDMNSFSRSKGQMLAEMSFAMNGARRYT